MKISSFALALSVSGLFLVASSARAQDASLDARLREALRNRINELNAATAPAPESAVKPKEPGTVTPATSPSTVSSNSGSATEDQLREALRNRLQQENAAAASSTASPDAGSPSGTLTSTTVATKPVARIPDLLAPPPSALPASKEARLAQLLQQYKADQISPEQYHTERAKIIAEP